MIIPGYLLRVNQLVRRLPTISFRPQKERMESQFQRLVIASEGLGKPNSPTTHFSCDSEVKQSKVSQNDKEEAMDNLIGALSVLQTYRKYLPAKFDQCIDGAVASFQKGVKVLGVESKKLVQEQLETDQQYDILENFEGFWKLLHSLHSES